MATSILSWEVGSLNSSLTMRRWLGDEVVVYQATTGNVRGELERVAADHVDLHTVAGSLTIAWSGVVAVLNHNARDLDADAALDA